VLVAVVSSPIPEPLVLAVLCAACCWSRRGGGAELRWSPVPFLSPWSWLCCVLRAAGPGVGGMLVAVVSSPIPEPLVLAVLCAACCWSRRGDASCGGLQSHS